MTIKEKILNLISKANSTTGKSDTDLTSGVNSLIEGYGQGEAEDLDAVLTEQEALIAELKAVLETKASGEGDGNNIVVKIVERTVTELTAKDLEGVTKIGWSAFESCGDLISIIIPDSVTSIGGNAFSGCNYLVDIVFGENSGLTEILKFAFYGCIRLPSITIPNGVRVIGNSAFKYCRALTSIVIPEGIETIEQYAFVDCTSMQEYDFSKCTSVPTLENKNVFSAIPSTCVMKIPSALFDEWKAATNWSNFADYMVAV